MTDSPHLILTKGHSLCFGLKQSTLSACMRCESFEFCEYVRANFVPKSELRDVLADIHSIKSNLGTVCKRAIETASLERS